RERPGEGRPAGAVRPAVQPGGEHDEDERGELAREQAPVPRVGERRPRHALVRGEEDAGGHLERHERDDGRDPEPSAEGPHEVGARGLVEPAPRDGQHERGDRELPAEPHHGPHHVHEPHQGPRGHGTATSRPRAPRSPSTIAWSTNGYRPGSGSTSSTNPPWPGARSSACARPCSGLPGRRRYAPSLNTVSNWPPTTWNDVDRCGPASTSQIRTRSPTRTSIGACTYWSA